MSENGRATISTVDARVLRIEEAQQRLEKTQLEQAGEIQLVRQEQSHIREIVTSRFAGLEGQIVAISSKLDTFMGRMNVLIEKSMEQQGDLKATSLGRQVDERLSKVEAWEQVSRDFHAELRGVNKTVRVLFGTSVLGVIVAIFSILNSIGVFASHAPSVGT